MAGWLPVRRTPKEQPTAPLRGFKLAHPMVSADGTRAGFARLLGGVAVTQDDTARPYDPVRPFDLSAEATAAAAAQVSGGTPHSAAATPALDGVTHAELVPVLTAEVALLQARLDEVQRQLVRLTDN